MSLSGLHPKGDTINVLSSPYKYSVMWKHSLQVYGFLRWFFFPPPFSFSFLKKNSLRFIISAKHH